MAYTQKAISGNPERNDGGTVFNGGNISASNVATSQVKSSQTTAVQPNFVPLAVSAAQSGTMGTRKAVSGGSFGKMYDGEYVAFLLADSIANVASTVLLKPANGGNADLVRRSIPYSESDRRLDITNWNYLTGVAQTGGGPGVLMDFGSDHAAHPTYAVPGEFAYQYGGATPAQADYPAKHGP